MNQKIKKQPPVSNLIENIQKMMNGKAFKNYIHHARFPNFKGLEENAKITFDFPLTALVGANGSGKSSILHALYGMPERYSTSRFWFSTDIDPIIDINKNPARYIYGHWHQKYNNIVETRKARMKRVNRNYEYWEPTKISIRDNMKKMPKEPYERKDADRWNPVQREVLYMNMKMVIGAFDRTMNFDDKINYSIHKGPTGQSEKHEEMLKGAKRLSRVASNNIQEWKLGGGRDRVFCNRLLNDNELEIVSRILGRKYISARYIEHSLYPSQNGSDLSVIFDRGIKYSEAYAGSGELSIVKIVTELLASNENTLVLLDEPETSLHPGAQRELLSFLLEMIIIKKLQIIISTHSSDMISELPNNAIKVLEGNGMGKTRIMNSCSSLIALNRLGSLNNDKTTIYVEDLMAKAVIERATRQLDPGEKLSIEIIVAPGGADTILKYIIPTLIIKESKSFVYLDGDQKLLETFHDPSTIPPSEYFTLDEKIKETVKCKPQLLLNGGNDKAGNKVAETDMKLKYLSWIYNNLSYLPRLCPDAIVLNSIDESATYNSSEEYKNALKQIYNDPDISSLEIITLSKHYLNKMDDNSADLVIIASKVKEWIQRG
ncbi:putative ATPase [Kluyvera sp. 1366]